MLDNRLGLFYFFIFYLKKIIKKFLPFASRQNSTFKFDLIKLDKKKIHSETKNYKTVLFICLENFETYFFYVWLIVFYSLRNKNLKLKVVTSKKNIALNLIIKKLKIEYKEIEVLINKTKDLDSKLQAKINNLNDFEDFYNFKYDSFDIGMMIISNFCRIHKVGFVNYKSKIQKYILKKTLTKFIREYEVIKNNQFFQDTEITFTFEKNLFYYLHFFILAIKKNFDLVHWSGANLDEKTFVIKKYSKNNIYSHHSSISDKLWAKVKNVRSKRVIKRNKEIFRKRFSGEYAPFSINLLECRKDSNFKIKKKNNKKNCIIFSHILHDTLYFFGKEFYDSYSHWLVSTIKLACKNTNVNWFIKIHPSNLYRGEFKKGFSKEEDIIRQEIKYIPSHIQFIYPDTKINPLSWMNFADVGITIRGTSGLEMAVLGKPVITCGKNRYENKGFTIDPKNKKDYEKMLLNLPKIKKINKKHFMRANIFYNYVFERKGFDCDFLKIKSRKKLFKWSDVEFELNKNFHKNKNLNKFKRFLLSNKEIEYIN